MSDNLFKDISESSLFSKSYMAILVFLLSLGMLAIGINHFVEDTYSSFIGIGMLESEFGLKPVSWEFTRWTMSLAPQVAQIIFFYLFLLNKRKNRWAFWIAFGFFFMDFFADVWYRSDGQIFSSLPAFTISFLMTIIYFTFGSEMFISIGFGLSLAMLKPFINQFKDFAMGLVDSITPGEEKSKPKFALDTKPELIQCRFCDAQVKPENLREHVMKVHAKEVNQAPSQGHKFPEIRKRN